MKKLIFIQVIILIALSCKEMDSKKVEIKGEKFSSTLDSIKYVNYVHAIENGSTFQYFTVVKIKNLNTNEIREICVKGNFLSGALHREYKLGYEKNDFIKVQNLLLANKERYFEFKDTSALNNLGLDKYSMNDLQNFESKNNSDSIVNSIKHINRNNYFSDDKEMLLLAHSLFNRGILIGENNCFGGNLFHVTDKMLAKRKSEIEEIEKKNTQH